MNRHETRRYCGVVWRAVLFAALSAVLVSAHAAWAAAPAAKPPAPAADPSKSPQEQQDDQVYGQLAKVWSAFFAGKYDQAIKQADPLAKLTDARYRWVAHEAVHIQARVCWADGTKDSQAKARELWAQLEKSPKTDAERARVKLAKALALEPEGLFADSPAVKPEAQAKPIDPAKFKPALDALDAVLQDPKHTAATVEAAIELGRLFVKAKRFDDAKGVLDWAIAFLTDKQNLTRMEIPEPLAPPYVAAARALLAHLKYDKNAGMAEFDAAEKLRKAEKFTEAGKAYQAVIKDFPDTEYAIRSDLAIGYCLAGLHQPGQAVEHWKKFITPTPAGAWRGQAYIALIDLYLEELLDLAEAGKYAELARASLPKVLAGSPAPAGKPGTPAVDPYDSWKAAAYDVYLRVGMVNFCQGKGQVAAEAFEEARKLTTNKTSAELDSLIAAAKAGQPVIPSDVGGTAAGGEPGAGADAPAAGVTPASKAALALSMGVMYLVAGRYDNSEAFFERVGGTVLLTPPAPARAAGKPPTATAPAGAAAPAAAPSHPAAKPVASPPRPPMPGATPAQLAFAIFGKGAILQAQHKPEEAKELFLASIKAFAAGAWHDESLYRVATIIQDQAKDKYGKAMPPAGPPATAPHAGLAAPIAATPATPVLPPQPDAAAKAEKERKLALAKARGEALPYWQEIIARYSATNPSTKRLTTRSPRCEDALYNAASLQYTEAEPDHSPHPQDVMVGPAAALRLAIDTYPASQYAPQAFLQLGNILVDCTLEFAQGLENTESGIALVTQPEASPSPLEAWRLHHQPSEPSTRPQTCYELYCRKALLHLLLKNPSAAQETCLHCPPYRPPAENDLPEARVSRLGKIAAGGVAALTPTTLRISDDTQDRLVRLADIYLLCFYPDRAACLYERSLDAKSSTSPHPELRAYLLWRLGQSYEYQERHDDAMLTWKILSEPHYFACPWAASGLFSMAVSEFNYTQNHNASVPLFKFITERFPQSPEAERAQAYYALGLLRLGRHTEAQAAFTTYLTRYPRGPWATSIREHYLPLLPK